MKYSFCSVSQSVTLTMWPRFSYSFIKSMYKAFISGVAFNRLSRVRNCFSALYLDSPRKLGECAKGIFTIKCPFESLFVVSRKFVSQLCSSRDNAGCVFSKCSCSQKRQSCFDKVDKLRLHLVISFEQGFLTGKLPLTIYPKTELIK